MKLSKQIQSFFQNIATLFDVLARLRVQKALIGMTALSVLIALGGIGCSVFYADAIDRVLTQAGLSAFLGSISLLVLLKIGVMALQTALDWLGSRTRNTMIARLRHLVLASLMDMDLEYFQALSYGELVDKIQGSTFDLADNLGLFLPELLRRLFVGSITLLFSVWLSPSLTFLFCGLCVLMLWLQIWGGNQCGAFMDDMIEARNLRDACVHELLDTTKTIQIFGLEKTTRRWFVDASNVFIRSFSTTMEKLALFFSPGRIVNDLSIVLPCALGVLQVRLDRLPLETFVTLLFVWSISAQEFKGLDGILGNLPTIIANAHDLDTLWSAPSDPAQTEDFQSRTPALDVQNAHYSFIHGNPGFRIEDLMIQSGEKVAIVGGNGSGKTTFLRTLAGLYPRYTGTIRWFGTEARDLKPGKIGYASQHPALFDDTLRNNVDPRHQKTDEQIRTMLNELGLSALCAKLNDPLEKNLSGGEKQRLALARTLLEGTNVLLLDEATSALDRKTAAKIHRTLTSKRDLTLLAILHDVEWLSLYNRVLVFENGMLKEDSDHA